MYSQLREESEMHVILPNERFFFLRYKKRMKENRTMTFSLFHFFAVVLISSRERLGSR